MNDLLTPGVYYQRVDASTPAVGVVRTDIAGLVGIAPRGPLDVAVPVESWRQYQAHFGGFSGAGFLAYAVRAFFENGGRRCWVVRVACKDPGAAAAAGITLRSTRDVWHIAASSPGAWGNRLTVTVRQTSRAQTRSITVAGRPEFSTVVSTSGFERGTLVRISQPPLAPQTRVVSEIDATGRRLWWVHDNPLARLPYDAPLTGFDPNQTILIESMEYTILVREAGRPAALFEGITLIPEHARYGPVILGTDPLPVELVRQGKLPSPPRSIVVEELRQDYKDRQPIAIDIVSAAPEPLLLAGGADGLTALGTFDFMGAPVSLQATDAQKELNCRGLRVFEEVDEIAAIAIPDIHIQPAPPLVFDPPPACIPDPCLPGPPEPPAPALPPPIVELPPIFTEQQIFQVQSAMVDQCEALRDRIAVLDPPASAALDQRLGTAAAVEWRTRFDSKYAALYYPWIRVVDPLRTSGGMTRTVPPSGFVTGQFAKTDFVVGVHKAPANSPLVWGQDLSAVVDPGRHGILNDRGINVIRTQNGRGIRILGARTVSSDASWAYVNVRRLMIMIRKAIFLAIQWAVMEPNDYRTQAKLRLVVINFLLELWQRGMLAGEDAKAAFFVKCDEENNPPEDRDNGRLYIDIGVAPSIPFEFVVLRVGRTSNEFEIAEAGVLQGGF